MKILIVDYKIPREFEKALCKEGFSLIKLPADPSLNEAVASHPDTVLFYSDGEIITTADYCDAAAYIFSDIRELRPEVKISFTADARGDIYPRDCIMNALVIGDRIFCKTDTVSDAIKDFATRRGYRLIHTNQGYPACSVLTFGESAITADRGLAEVMMQNGVRVTLIGAGSISLPPYEYGFIGGASGVINNKVYFFGDITSHPDSEKICQAIRSEGYIPCSLSSGELRDVGGFIAL